MGCECNARATHPSIHIEAHDNAVRAPEVMRNHASVSLAASSIPLYEIVVIGHNNNGRAMSSVLDASHNGRFDRSSHALLRELSLGEHQNYYVLLFKWRSACYLPRESFVVCSICRPHGGTVDQGAENSDSLDL